MELLKNKYFNYLVYIFLIILSIFFIGKLNYIIKPAAQIFTVILYPILIGSFLYYLLRPMVNYLTGKINNKILSIILTILVVLFLISLLSYFGGNIIVEQFKDLIEDISIYYNQQWNDIDQNLRNGNGVYQYISKFNIQNKLTSILENVISTIRNNITSFFSTITNYGTIILLIPFVLFYFLKDDKIIFKNILNILPQKHKKQFYKILIEIDETLATYISGRLIVSILLGILTYIGFLIIKLPNALVLSFIIFITSFIPIIGPIFGSLPALFIAITTNIWLVLKVLIVILSVQILEGNVIQPGIQGGILKIHPLNVIFSVLVFTILFGIIGALFAVPFYVIIRIIVKYLFFKEESSV
mgnify:CR=1 FL=1